jgi:dihydroxyacetone kinase DhaKLM complex PTS-EIIA-like component DhaM
MALTESAQLALDHVWETYGDDAEKMARKLAEFAWLEGWIAALTYLKGGASITHAPENPYLAPTD